MRKFISTLLAGGLALTMVSGVSAQTTPNTTVEVTCNVTANCGFSAAIGNTTFDTKPYSFVAQPSSGTVVVNIEDNRGTGAGWNVTLAGTDFERTDGREIAIGNLSLADGAVTSDPLGANHSIASITAPGITVGETTPGEKITIAQALAGMGHYTATYPATLNIPGGTLIGTYRSTLTVTITTGP